MARLVTPTPQDTDTRIHLPFGCTSAECRYWSMREPSATNNERQVGRKATCEGTVAHNTILIDGLDQSEQTGPFNWGRRAHGHLISAQTRSQTNRDGQPMMG